MQQDEVLALLREANAVLKGHFLLASGLHSDTYFQCAKVFEQPGIGSRVAQELAGRWADTKIDVVAGPALGGVIVAYELARALGARCVYFERVDGAFQLRRGFEIKPGDRVLVAEDVVTTGGSAKEVVELARHMAATVVGVSAIVYRQQDKKFDEPLRYLIAMNPPAWKPPECPLPGDPIKPGAPKPNK